MNIWLSKKLIKIKHKNEHGDLENIFHTIGIAIRLSILP